MRSAKDYYELLEVHPKARQEIIDKAYRVLVRAYHPDIHPQEQKGWAEEILKQLNDAYQTLRDPEKRAEYDRMMGFARLYETGPLPNAIKCFNHPKVVAIAECSECHRPICRQCFIEVEDTIYCMPCAARKYVPPPPQPDLGEPAMGWAGALLFYSVAGGYIGMVTWALLNLVYLEAPGGPWLEVSAVVALVTAALLALLHWRLRALCPQCDSVISEFCLRIRAPWSEFWRPTCLCPHCGQPLHGCDFHWRVKRELSGEDG